MSRIFNRFVKLLAIGLMIYIFMMQRKDYYGEMLHKTTAAQPPAKAQTAPVSTPPKQPEPLKKQ